MLEERLYYRLWVRFTDEKEWKLIGEYDYLEQVFSAIKTLLDPEHDFLIDDFRIQTAIEAEPTPEEIEAIEEGRKKGEFIELEKALKTIRKKKRKRKKRERK